MRVEPGEKKERRAKACPPAPAPVAGARRARRACWNDRAPRGPAPDARRALLQRRGPAAGQPAAAHELPRGPGVRVGAGARGRRERVARGMLAGRGKYRVFTDADLAFPPVEVTKILRDLEQGADVAIACRVLPESLYVMSPSFFHYLYTRHVMSRGFNALVRALLLRGVLDSQAGLKGFTARAAEVVFRRLTVARFGFDVEALFIAQKHGFTIRQTAVHFRYDEEPTTVRFARSAVTMGLDLVKVRLNDWRGRYR